MDGSAFGLWVLDCPRCAAAICHLSADVLTELRHGDHFVAPYWPVADAVQCLSPACLLGDSENHDSQFKYSKCRRICEKL